MENVASQRYVGDEYLKKNPSYHLEHAARKAEELVAILDADGDVLRALAADGGAEILEIGCGAGGVISEMASRLGARDVAGRYTGYDISPGAIEIATARWANVEFRCEDFLVRPRPADLALMIDFFEHLEDPAVFLRAIRPNFRWVLFRIPLDWNLYNRALGRFDDLRERLGHLHYFDRQSARRLLVRCGYTVRRELLVENFRDPSNLRTRGARWNYYPRALLSATSRALCARLWGGISMVILADAAAGEDLPIRR